MVMYDIARDAVIGVDAVLRQVAVRLAREVATMGNEPMKLHQARRANTITRRLLIPLYGRTKSRATGSLVFREIATHADFATETVFRDIVRSLDRAMRETDPEAWGRVRDFLDSGKYDDDFARIWISLNGPSSQAQRQLRSELVDPNRRWVDPRGYRLSDRVWNIGVEQRKQIDRILRDGVRAGDGPLKVAKRLEMYLNPDYAPVSYRRNGQIVRRNVTRKPAGSGSGSTSARRLARTEIVRVHADATEAMMASLEIPEAGIRWALSAAHPEIDICDDLARRSSRGFPPGVYRPGEVPRVPHPACLCSRIPVLPSREKVLDYLVERYQGGFGF